MRIFKCANCGTEVIARSNRQKFCDMCARNHCRDYQKRYHEGYAQTEGGHNNIKKALYNQRRKILSKDIKETFTMKQWLKKVDKTEGVCPMCKEFIGKDKMTMDHTYPIQLAEDGRVYTIDDVTPMCGRCNTIKGNRLRSRT